MDVEASRSAKAPRAPEKQTNKNSERAEAGRYDSISDDARLHPASFWTSIYNHFRAWKIDGVSIRFVIIYASVALIWIVVTDPIVEAIDHEKFNHRAPLKIPTLTFDLVESR